MRGFVFVFALLLSALPLCGQHSADVPECPRRPVIDGVITPDEWDSATRISDFRQVEPVEGGEPSERTVLWLCADADSLYIAVQCFDSEPEKIIATLQRRDANLDPDDRIEIILDTFLDKRNAYFIQLGAGGSRGDALIGNNGTQFSKDWDGIWEGAVSRNSEGWMAEFALPAASFSMSADHRSFGFNIERTIKRKNEEIRWANPSRRWRFFTPVSAGIINGLERLDQGHGLDIRPYVKARATRDWMDQTSHSSLDLGFDARWRINSALTATFTVNTDFAETEVDSRVINLERFPVFFPEKRDFFLEDVSIFAFGGLGGMRGALGDPVPLFTRSIGLAADGRTVPILGGVRVTGRMNDWNIGVLDVQLDSIAGLPGGNIGVARISRNILEESTVGILATGGDPASLGRDAMAGADFTWRISDFLGDKVLKADFFALGTFPDSTLFTADEDFGWALGAKLTYPNDIVFAELSWREISESFDPALGFSPRQGVRRLLAGFEYRPRLGTNIRRLEFGIQPDVWLWRDTGEVQSATIEFKPIGIELESEDEFALVIAPEWSGLREPFEIYEGVIIPPGLYDFVNAGVEFSSSNSRALRCEGGAVFGTFYGGHATRIGGELEYRPGSGLLFALGAEHDSVTLPQGNFSVALASLRTEVQFSPNVSWMNFVQYDTESRSIGINSRLHWSLRDGDDAYLVLNQGLQERDILSPNVSGFEPTTTNLALKLALTFRF
ncbi:MAG: hypothetical protein EXS14_01925 [Planctomycetes bacterium]|nr:hypothetical protein [Planctomycetota bacterium]